MRTNKEKTLENIQICYIISVLTILCKPYSKILEKKGLNYEFME